ncbi:hypothetical protein DFH09DRAFT_860767, partial [Mycena vulgaris]
LFRVAFDVLLVQASAVPCERVFSSSKETDALRCGNLSQLLWRCSKSSSLLTAGGRVNFADEWVATEEELSVIDVAPEVLEELLATGQIQQMVDLFKSSW